MGTEGLKGMGRSADAAGEAERMMGNTAKSAKKGDAFQGRQQQIFQKTQSRLPSFNSAEIIKNNNKSNFRLSEKKITGVSLMSPSVSQEAVPRASEEGEE